MVKGSFEHQFREAGFTFKGNMMMMTHCTSQATQFDTLHINIHKVAKLLCVMCDCQKLTTLSSKIVEMNFCLAAAEVLDLFPA